jgi:hypothetical protein
LEERLLGEYQRLYDFGISQIITGKDAAKFMLYVNRYAIGTPIEIDLVHQDSYGLASGHTVPIPNTHYILILERVDGNTAYFRVMEDNMHT